MLNKIICGLLSLLALKVSSQPCLVTMDLPNEVCTVDNSFDLNQFVSPTGGTWNVPGGIFDPATYAPGTTVTITYTYIDPSVPCTTALSSDILVIGDCCGNNGVNTVPLYGDVSSNYGAGWTGVQASIHGDFVIDNNFIIDNSVVPIREGVTITVKTGVTLTVTNNSYLFSCKLNMWEGIFVEPGGILVIEDDSWVEDAEIAVHADGVGGIPTSITANNAHFNKNVYDIFVKNGNIGLNYPLQVINGSTFTAFPQTPYSPSTGLDNNFNSLTKPKYHIFLDHITSEVVIGDVNTARNEFSEGEIGIRADNSELRAYNNSFTDFLQPIALGSPPHAGIYAITDNKAQSIVVGENNSGNNLFQDCSAGIIIINYNKILVEENLIRQLTLYPPLQTGIGNGQRGIAIRNDYLATGHYDVIVNNNTVRGYLEGINVRFNNSLIFTNTQLHITDNRIWPSIVADNGNSINVTSTIPSGLSGTNNDWKIAENSIIDCTLGIFVSGIRSAQLLIDNNNITLDGTTPQIFLTGMRLENNYKLSVINNEIKGNGFSSSFINQRGMLVQDDIGNEFRCNEFKKLGQSLVFDGLNPSTISGNKFQQAYDGFVLRNSGEVGQQGIFGQPSDNRWSGSFGRGQTTVLNTALANVSSSLYVRSFPSGFLPTLNYGLPPSLPYILGQGLQTTFGQFVECPAISPFKTLEIQVARSQHAFDFFEVSAQWTGKQLLYAEMLNDSSLFSEPVLDSFYVSSTNECFAHANYLLEALSNGDTSLAIYHQQQINPSCLPAQNFKDFYSVYLNWMMTSQFDSMDRAVVTLIADECPIVGGTVVFSARKFLESLDNAFIWHDDELCAIPENRNFAEQSSLLNQISRIYPNPASEFVTVEVEENCTFDLKEIGGKTVLSGQLYRGENYIQLSEFSNGMYILNLSFSSGCLSNKISINR